MYKENVPIYCKTIGLPIHSIIFRLATQNQERDTIETLRSNICKHTDSLLVLANSGMHQLKLYSWWPL